MPLRTGAVGRMNSFSQVRLGSRCFLLSQGQILVSGLQSGCTQSARMSVRGTNYVLNVAEDGQTELSVLEGRVAVERLRTGESTAADSTSTDPMATDPTATESTGVEPIIVEAGQKLTLSPQGVILTLPAWQVLDPERWRTHPLRSRLRDAVVLVGPVVNQGGSGTPTPFGPISGLELVATAAANSIAGDGLVSWPSSRWARGLLAMMPGVLLLLFASRFSNSGWRLVAVAGVLLGLLYGGDAYLREEGERRRLRRTFERYVAPSVVAEILSDPGAAEGILRGRALQVTVLFTDLKGFTQLTRARSSQGQIVQHEAVVGQIGSPRRMEFTAIGDTVNLASRMEGLTRLAGEPILCDARTAELAAPVLETRSIGEQAVKGMGAQLVFTLAAEPAP